MTEQPRTPKAFLDKIIFSTDNGWRFHHETLSIMSAAGWPDLVCIRIKDRWDEEGNPNYPFVLFLEVKTEKGKLRPAQVELWTQLGDLQNTTTEVRFAVVRPSNLNQIEKWIQGKEPR